MSSDSENESIASAQQLKNEGNEAGEEETLQTIENGDTEKELTWEELVSLR